MSTLIESDVKVFEDGSVEGTLKHVTGYTQFSEQPEEQEGYYFPFKLVKSGTTMTIKENGQEIKQDVAWEADNVLRVTATDEFEILVDDALIAKLNFAKATFAE